MTVQNTECLLIRNAIKFSDIKRMTGHWSDSKRWLSCFKACSHLTFAFTSPSQFNILSIATQTLMKCWWMASVVSSSLNCHSIGRTTLLQPKIHRSIINYPVCPHYIFPSFTQLPRFHCLCVVENGSNFFTDNLMSRIFWPETVIFKCIFFW